jgi:hypothetical protein
VGPRRYYQWQLLRIRSLNRSADYIVSLIIVNECLLKAIRENDDSVVVAELAPRPLAFPLVQ